MNKILNQNLVTLSINEIFYQYETKTNIKLENHIKVKLNTKLRKIIKLINKESSTYKNKNNQLTLLTGYICIISTIIYIKNNSVPTNQYDYYNYVLFVFMLSFKLHEDNFSIQWVNVLDLTLEQIISGELQLMKKYNWKIYIDPKEFFETVHLILKESSQLNSQNKIKIIHPQLISVIVSQSTL